MTDDGFADRYEALVADVGGVLDLGAGLAAAMSGGKAEVLPMDDARPRDLDRLADGVRDVLDLDAGLAAIVGRRAAPVGAGPVLVVDDHELVGSALASSLRSEGEEAHFHPVRSAADVLDRASRLTPGLVVLDLDLGRDADGKRIDGVRLVEPLVSADWRVVVLSGSSDPARLGAALAAGGFVWVPKSAPFPTLLTAIREARAGRSVMPAGRREQLIELYRAREQERRETAGAIDRLTPREREVLALLASGHRAQAIADHFVVSLATVRSQIRAILGKLAVGSQLEAAAVYRRAAR